MTDTNVLRYLGCFKMDIKKYGYSKFFKDQFERLKKRSFFPARVVSQSRNLYKVVCEKGFFDAKLSGSLRRDALFKSDLSAVGDWVVISIKRDKAYIHETLQRKSCITRKTSGKVFNEQVLSANVDIAFIVSSLDEDFNIKRIRRYISLAKTGKVKPVILLSKSDLKDDCSEFLQEVKDSAANIPVHAVSVKNKDASEVFKEYLKEGITSVFIGSSGVGKSTLINMLLGSDRQKTGEISEKAKKGKHITSSRELILIKDRGLVIDTPGIRELQVWNEDIDTGYEDIEILSCKCRFFDCCHDTEPDCEVKKAVEDGVLSKQRLENWRAHKLEIENLKKMKELSAKIFAKRKVKKNKSDPDNVS